MATRLAWGRAACALVAAGMVPGVGARSAGAQVCDPVEAAKFVASKPGPYGRYGGDVSMSGDTIVVAARSDEGTGRRINSAYVYTRTDGTWAEQALLLPTVVIRLQDPGHAVAVSGDTALIGSHYDLHDDVSTGAAYVFSRRGDGWTQQARLLADDGDRFDYLGITLALDGDTAVVGASGGDDNGFSSGSVYVFVRHGGVWTQQAKLTASDGAAYDNFGASVVVRGDTAVVGATGDDDNGTYSGSAYVFTRRDGVWTERAKLLAPDGSTGDAFGASVAMSGDTILVGASWDNLDKVTSAGSVYAFVGSGGAWTLQDKLTASDYWLDERFGASVAIDGDTAVIGAPQDDGHGRHSGSSYVFTRRGGVWRERAKLLPGDVDEFDAFGTAVALDGDTAVFGTPSQRHDDFEQNAGAVYIYDLGCDECPADFSGDGVVNTEDVLAFLRSWAGREHAADWNRDGTVNTQDVLAYLNDWAAGC